MRSPRLLVPGYPHHVTERGVRKEPTFYDDSDRLVYIRVLRDACHDKNVQIWAYALMTNHIHLVAVPTTATGLSEALRDAHTSYTMYFNVKYGFKGHAWEARPSIFLMETNHLWNAVRYVELNPVRARMVVRAEHYAWSSAAAHCGLREDPLLSADCPLQGVIDNWSEWLGAGQSEHELKQFREHAAKEKALGSVEFVRKLEAETGRKLLPRKVGRPAKK
jgi:putative transposase